MHKIISIFTVIIMLLAQNARAEKIIIAADYWCPYNCKPDTEYPGYLVELVTKAFAKYNIDVEYKLMPWRESVEAAKAGNVHAVIGASKDEADGLILPSFALAEGPTGVYVINGDRWVLDGMESLRKKELCLIVGYGQSGVVEQYIYENYPASPQLFVVEDGLYASNDCLARLMEHRVDILIENDYVMDNMTKNLRSKNDVVKAGNLGLENLYLALSPNHNKSYYYMKILGNAMSEMKKNGEALEIAQKYGLQ
ncbi:MAG: transporter substrate-binding domain-containing protein [Pseudomonadota bacterium]